MARYTSVARIDTATHPLFVRLFGEKGFLHLNEESVDEFLAVPGLKLAIFAEDPNLQKETMDICVIGPEIAGDLQGLAQKRFADCTQARALAARWGVKRLPAVALFRGADFLGACEGLLGWDEYLARLAQIAARTAAPRRTIAILPGSAQ